jgi:hypothetical protein
LPNEAPSYDASEWSDEEAYKNEYLRPRADRIDTTLSTLKPEQTEMTRICWGKNDFKCFADLDDDVMYLIAMTVATWGKSSPREWHIQRPKYGLSNRIPNLPNEWLSPDLWRFRLISRACAAIGKSVWINLCLAGEQKRKEYNKLHLPPRCGDLSILKRIICDSGLSKIVKEVVYHAHPVYTERWTEGQLRQLLDNDTWRRPSCNDDMIARVGTELMIKQQQEQAAFFQQLSLPDGFKDLAAILGALDTGVCFTVKTKRGLSVDWLDLRHHHWSRAEHPASTPFVGLMIALLSPEQVRLDCCYNTLFAMDMAQSLQDPRLSCIPRVLSLDQSLGRVIDLKLTKINVENRGLETFYDRAGAERRIEGVHGFLSAMRNLKSLEISFDWHILSSGLRGFGSKYAENFLNGMLKGQVWLNLEKLSLHHAAIFVSGLVDFIVDQPCLETVSTRDLYLKNEQEAVMLLAGLGRSQSMSWSKSEIDVRLESMGPVLDRETQTLIDEIRSREHGRVYVHT